MSYSIIPNNTSCLDKYDEICVLGYSKNSFWVYDFWMTVVGISTDFSKSKCVDVCSLHFLEKYFDKMGQIVRITA